MHAHHVLGDLQQLTRTGLSGLEAIHNVNGTTSVDYRSRLMPSRGKTPSTKVVHQLLAHHFRPSIQLSHCIHNERSIIAATALLSASIPIEV